MINNYFSSSYLCKTNLKKKKEKNYNTVKNNCFAKYRKGYENKHRLYIDKCWNVLLRMSWKLYLNERLESNLIYM